jgi:preprotein translocase subunit SecA
LRARGWRQHDFADGDALPRSSDGTVTGRIFAILNARHHAREAQIIAEAGLPGAVTIATAMAGRGTDIRLGGLARDDDAAHRVRASGGLLVIGTEPHELLRIDDQLRGRAGRQGDPGRTSFHLSPEDDLFAGTAQPILNEDRFDLEKRVRDVQARHAAQNSEERLSLARFDEVIDLQRQALASQRTSIRDTTEPLDVVRQFREQTIDDLMTRFAPRGVWRDTEGLDASVRAILTLAIDFGAFTDNATLRDHITATADQWMAQKITASGSETIGDVLRRVMLALIDQLWAEQSERLEHIKRAVGDRRLPRYKMLADFRIEAFASFEQMQKELRHEVTAHAMRLGIIRT